MEIFSIIVLPIIVLTIIIYGYKKKVNIYESFLKGVLEGLKTSLNIFPSILAMIFAVNILISSGIIETLLIFLHPLLTKYNLSDIFEYMSDEQMCNIFEKIFTKSSSGSIIAYWNMLADKRASKYFDNLEYKEKKSQELLNKDKAFFYSKFIIEEIK